MTDSSSDIERKVDFARMFMRKDRPLPKQGCSWAFFIFLGLIVVALVVVYFIYKDI